MDVASAAGQDDWPFESFVPMHILSHLDTRASVPVSLCISQMHSHTAEESHCLQPDLEQSATSGITPLSPKSRLATNLMPRRNFQITPAVTPSRIPVVRPIQHSKHLFFSIHQVHPDKGFQKW